jgi:hypothetical protein
MFARQVARLLFINFAISVTFSHWDNWISFGRGIDLKNCSSSVNSFSVYMVQNKGNIDKIPPRVTRAVLEGLLQFDNDIIVIFLHFNFPIFPFRVD